MNNCQWFHLKETIVRFLAGFAIITINEFIVYAIDYKLTNIDRLLRSLPNVRSC
jgi:hypothetical protein